MKSHMNLIYMYMYMYIAMMVPFPSIIFFRSESESLIGFFYIFTFEPENIDIGASSDSIKHVVCALGPENI